MNILIVTRPLGPPWNEGSKNLAYNIAKNIKNHNIHLVVRKNFNEKVNSNIILHRIYPNKHNYKISYVEKLRLFFFLLKIRNIDIYHFIYTPELYSSRINRFLMKIKSKKSIQTIPTRLRDNSNLKKLFFADKIVTISDFTKKLLLRNKIKNIIKLNTGVDTNYFKPSKKKISLLNKFKGKFVILIPIYFEKKKTMSILFKVIKKLNDLENILFVFPYRSTGKNISKERLLRTKLYKLGLNNLIVKDPKNIRDLINVSNLVVYLYSAVDTYEKHEIPMILLESMAIEKPIIMWDKSPMNEIIKGKEGIKVKNYLDMKKVIVKFVKDKNFAKKVGRLARKRIVNDFNIIKTAKDYSRLYNKL